MSNSEKKSAHKRKMTRLRVQRYRQRQQNLLKTDSEETSKVESSSTSTEATESYNQKDVNARVSQCPLKLTDHFGMINTNLNISEEF